MEGQGAPATGETSAGEWPHGWQCHATRIQPKYYRDRVLMPALSPTLFRSQAGPQAGMWLTAIPAEAATTLPPQAMLVALQRRLRLALPLCPRRCGPNPGRGGTVDTFGDHALACPRTGLLARRAKVVERAWVQVAWEAVGPESQVVPQQWLAHTTAPGVQPQDRRRLPGPRRVCTTRGGALCCDATLVSPLTRTGHPQPCAVQIDGAGPPCKLQSLASRQPTPSSRAEARKHCWCWGPRSAVDGAPGPGASSATCSACGPNARLLPPCPLLRPKPVTAPLWGQDAPLRQPSSQHTGQNKLAGSGRWPSSPPSRSFDHRPRVTADSC